MSRESYSKKTWRHVKTVYWIKTFTVLLKNVYYIKVLLPIKPLFCLAMFTLVNVFLVLSFFLQSLPYIRRHRILKKKLSLLSFLTLVLMVSFISFKIMWIFSLMLPKQKNKNICRIFCLNSELLIICRLKLMLTK